LFNGPGVWKIDGKITRESILVKKTQHLQDFRVNHQFHGKARYKFQLICESILVTSFTIGLS
jgi:hypothetical protein